MKFNINGNTPAPREVKAYLDSDGDLVVPTGDDDGEATCIMTDGTILKNQSWRPEAERNRGVFYEGDTLTISF